ncbi:MAG TPA: Flp pilus assembly protein CpaB [Thermoanaerobaculia bacterium]|nr:Flp pilus assembly protein CpaB [Thermoanaerobaculia bacterium]
MSKRAKILISLILGLLAAFTGMIYISGKKAEIEGNNELIGVYVANADFAPNRPMDPEKIGVKMVPRNYLQPDSILTAEIPNARSITGIPIVPIKSGEQIVKTKLYLGAPPALSADLKQYLGMVGVGVNVRQLPSAVGGNVMPGDHADVLASFKFEKSKDEEFTEIRPLLYDIPIIAVNLKTVSNIIAGPPKTGEEQRDDVRNVTLALAPAAAQQVILAQQLGDIWLVLRAPGDKTEHHYEVWNNERLLQSPYRLWRAGSANQQQMDALSSFGKR